MKGLIAEQGVKYPEARGVPHGFGLCGHTGLATGVASGALDSVALVLIAGDVPTHYYGEHTRREVNLPADASQYEIYRQFVKRARRVDSPHLLPDIVEKAFRLADTGRSGPVLVDVTMTIVSSEIDGAPWKRVLANASALAKLSLDDETAAKIINALPGAKKPVMYAGGGIALADAAQAIAERVPLPRERSKAARDRHGALKRGGQTA